MSDNQLFKPEIRDQLQQVLSGLNREQLLWLGGYISAAIDFAPSPAVTIAEQPPRPVALTPVTDLKPVVGQKRSLVILYGSHSGNSQKVATLAGNEAEKQGVKVRVVNMEDYNARFLKDEEQILVVVSTHGEGEPPLAAQELYTLLAENRVPAINGQPFGVIALGDSSYKKYCQTGIDFHQFLTKIGGVAIGDTYMLDTDFNNELPALLPSIIKSFAGATSNVEVNSSVKAEPVVSHNVTDLPFEVPVIQKIQLNGRGSDKETWHVEISTDNKGLIYQPGDALEVFASNDARLVQAILERTGLKGDEVVSVDGKNMSLTQALESHYELTVVTSRVLKKYAALLPQSSLSKLLEDAEKTEQFLDGLDVLDLIEKHPAKVDAGQFLSILRQLPPRAYSISSSPVEVGREIHLTVAAVRFDKDNRSRGGVCSTYLADRIKETDSLKVRLRPNDNFRLPANGDLPVIMVGAGTGIAPFRAFMQHRSALGSKGKNWLVFGDRHFTTDFLYQAEWLKYKKNGILTRLDVAFSRDQEEKRYVQHCLKQHGKELYRWLAGGAHFYVCGDMEQMAAGVKNAVLDVLQIEGKMGRDESVAYLAKLKKEGRYQEDVY